MHTSIKFLLLFIVLNITSLHGMEVEIPSKKRPHSLDELTTSNNAIVMDVDEQKDDTYLWLTLPDDLLQKIIYMYPQKILKMALS